MSNNLSTAMQLGAKAPFILIMKLEKKEREFFIAKITPDMPGYLRP